MTDDKLAQLEAMLMPDDDGRTDVGMNWSLIAAVLGLIISERMRRHTDQLECLGGEIARLRERYEDSLKR